MGFLHIWLRLHCKDFAFINYIYLWTIMTRQSRHRFLQLLMQWCWLYFFLVSACNCNGHSKQCRFNNELYKLSGKVSGGVCVNCRHSTSGRHCHYCKEGYYRDPLKPLNHRKVCKCKCFQLYMSNIYYYTFKTNSFDLACDCHPIGSVGKMCNNLTGQCQCKEGVTGLSCNKCGHGYKQSRSQNNPCISKYSDFIH